MECGVFWGMVSICAPGLKNAQFRSLLNLTGLLTKHASNLKDVVSSLLWLKNMASKKTRLLTLCVTNGKGGVGKTSFAANFAIALAGNGSLGRYPHRSLFNALWFPPIFRQGHDLWV